MKVRLIPRLRILFRIAGALFLLACALFALGLVTVLWGLGGNAVLPADCGVVFGAAVHPVFDSNGKMISIDSGPGIERRVGTAARLYREHLLRRLFMTGGSGEGMPKSEAAVMRDVAVRDGVRPEDIVLEDRSRNTEENIRYTEPLTGSCASVVAISDGYHLARIGIVAYTRGWKLSTVPAQRSPDVKFEAKSVIREIGALFMFTLKSLLT